MDIMKYSAASFIIGLAVVVSVIIGTNGIRDVKNTNASEISATGSATEDITSDLIVWGGSFSQKADTTKAAYDLLKKDTTLIRNYLKDKGVAENQIIFSSIDIRADSRTDYKEMNNEMKEIQLPDGYTLTQRVSISSPEVDKIESISRDITQLIDAGVAFLSDAPEYYYTKLDALKLEMISKATANARTRAEILADNAKASLGDLKNANLGVFQITATNSSDEEYSSGGTFNTWSKYKTASITVKLSYDIAN